MTRSMPGAMPMLVPTLLLLAACTPATPPPDVAGPAPSPTPAAETARAGEIPAAPTAGRAPAPAPSTADSAAGDPRSASIAGAIRDGNRAPPALRVCATPVDGGAPTCIDTAQGAREYRLDVAPGRYYLLGWAKSGDVKLIAHASQIRCIRAPCPPDELIVVSVGAGQQREGVDLGGGYPTVPAGWPQHPG